MLPSRDQWRILTALFCCMSGLLGGSTADADPQWIWAHDSARTFEISSSCDLDEVSGPILLKTGANFCIAQFLINGKEISELSRQHTFETRDVTHWLRRGENEVRVIAISSDGPAAVAFELFRSSDSEPLKVLSYSSSVTCQGKDSVQNLGDAAFDPWWTIAEKPEINAFDEYNQWEEAKEDATSQSRHAFDIQDGFQVDLVYTAKRNEGSWVSLEIDSQDRVLLGREDQGILRLVLDSQEVRGEQIDDTLRGVHGLLIESGYLYASANRSQGLYRFKLDEQDNPVSSPRLIKSSPGRSGDHGRHDVIPDNTDHVFVVHGDSVAVPDDSPSFLPRTHETPEGYPNEGHVIRVEPNSQTWTVFCGGLRNPYGLAKNQDGEVFTFDADAERHTGLPWYRPTRIVHLMAGVDYGWRNPGRPHQGYLPDLFPATVHIGRGSPTSIMFGSSSRFPSPFREALFALDWSYGRILVVHIEPTGSSYTGHADVFLRGRPFSVCDLDFDSKGDMFIITGGRDTVSSLYRIRPTADRSKGAPASTQGRRRHEYSKSLRNSRRMIEAKFTSKSPQDGHDNVGFAWQFLDHADPGIRSAARILLEHQPVDVWRSRIEPEASVAKKLAALLAIVRTGTLKDLKLACDLALSLPIDDTTSIRYLCRIGDWIDGYASNQDVRTVAFAEKLNGAFPTGDDATDRQLCEILARHETNSLVSKTLARIADETNPIDRLHYLFCLSDVEQGWTTDGYNEYMRLAEGAKRHFTDEGFRERLGERVEHVISNAPDELQAGLRDLFSARDESSVPRVDTESLPLVHRWTTDAVLRLFKSKRIRGTPERGTTIYKTAQCDRCHRFGSRGRTFGPDLTTVGRRFEPRHLLDQILAPSKTISSEYQNYAVELRDGTVLTGQVVSNGFRKSKIEIAQDPMNLTETQTLHKSAIVRFEPLRESPMPSRLLDGLNIQQIADLLAYLERGPN